MSRPKLNLTDAEKKEKKSKADKLRREMRKKDPYLLEELRLKERLWYLRRRAEGKIKSIKDKSNTEQSRQRTMWKQNSANYRMKRIMQGESPSSPLPTIVPSSRPESRFRNKGDPRTAEHTFDDDSLTSSSINDKLQPPTKKLREADPIARQNELLKLACDLLSTTSKQEETNEFLDIGKVWGTKLMSLDPLQRKFAEKAINEVLFEADLGTLHRESVKINCNNG